MQLLLIPTPLDFGCEAQVALTDVLPELTISMAAQTTHWICENAKSCRAFLKRVAEVVPLAAPLQQHVMTELPREVHKKGDHAGAFDAQSLLQRVVQAAQAAGQSRIGLVCEAGIPAVADPGSSIVRAAHALHLVVKPLVGPSALLMALAASGLGGQNFAFVGYLPIEEGERVQRIRELEALAWNTGQTQMFIEVPHRNAALWRALLSSLKADTRLAWASGLSLPQAQIQSASVAEWRQRSAGVDWKLPSVFAIGR